MRDLHLLLDIISRLHIEDAGQGINRYILPSEITSNDREIFFKFLESTASGKMPGVRAKNQWHSAPQWSTDREKLLKVLFEHMTLSFGN